MTPQALFADLARRYPDLWKSLDAIRAARGVNDVPSWLDSCFLPVGIAVEYAKIAAQTGGFAPAPGDGFRMAVLGGWRPAQDVYRFEPELFEALTTTPMDKIPSEVLRRLPAWAVYIETPGADWIGPDMAGFWAAMSDHDGKPELVLVPDYEGGGFSPLMLLPLDRADMQDAITAGISGVLKDGERLDEAAMREHENWPRLVAAMTKMLSLVLYICSNEPDIRHTSDSQSWPPAMPAPKKIKTGWRLFAADKPTIWRVGETIARQIRAARSEHSGPHAGPRPHIRRAHWHGFWSGTIKPREGVEPKPRKFELKWLPPVPVAMGDEDKDG